MTAGVAFVLCVASIVAYGCGGTITITGASTGSDTDRSVRGDGGGPITGAGRDEGAVTDASVPVEGIIAPALNGTFVELMGLEPFSWPPLDPNLEMDPPSSGGLFVDLDGDGKNEVVITQLPGSGAGRSIVYRYDGQRLVRAPDIRLPIDDFLVAAMDLDGDGLLDLVFTGAVFFGLGGGQYKNASLPPGTFGISAIGDVDGNGLPDLMLTPWCSTPQILEQSQPRTFVPNPGLVVPGGNVNPNAGFIGTIDDQVMLGMIGFACAGNETDVPIFYRKAAGAREFTSIALVPGFSLSKNSPMGATTGADLDGDGHLDLLVMLSPQHLMVSNGKESPQSFYYVNSPTTGKGMIPWTALLLDLDYDGRMDVMFTHGADNLLSQRTAGIGKEITTAHWNSGKGFGQFPSLGALDLAGEWRILGVGDLDDDGDPDVILGGFGEDPHVFRNDTKGNGVALRFITRLGVPGLSTKLVLKASTTQVLQVAGIGTYRQVNEPLVFAGLGAMTEGQLEITWPDGGKQTETVRAGRLTEIRQK